MADAIVPGRGLGIGRFRDKALCDRVKGLIRKQHPDVSENDDRFWELTTSLYRKMGGTMLKAGRTPFTEAKFFVKDGRLMLKARRAAEIGEIREWQGKKYKKTIDGWIPAGEKPTKEWVQEEVGKEKPKEKFEKPKYPEIDKSKKTALKNAVKSLITTLTDVFAGKGGEGEAARGIEQAGQAAVEKGKKKATQKKKNA